MKPSARAADLPIRTHVVAPPLLVLVAVFLAIGVALFAGDHPSLALAGLGAAYLAIAILVRPDTATLVIVFIIYTNAAAIAVSVHGVPYMLGAGAALLLVAPFAFHILVRRQPIVTTPALPFVLGFVLVQAVSAIVSADPGKASEEVTASVVEGFIPYVLLTNVVRTAKSLRGVTWTLIIAGAGIGGLTLLQGITASYYSTYGGFAQVDQGFFLGLTEEPELTGPIGETNYYAQVLVMVAAISLLLAWTERSPRPRLAAVLGTILIGAGIVLSSSRGGMVAFALVVVVMAFLRYIKLHQMLAILLALGILLVAMPDYRERVSSIGNASALTSPASGETEADTFGSRMTEMLAAAFVFADHPVIGVGPGIFENRYQEYAARVGGDIHTRERLGEEEGQIPQRGAHNLFLGIAAELGALGTVFFAGILVVTLRELGRARRRLRDALPDLANLVTGFILAIVAYLGAGFFLSFAYERYFWLLVALAGAAASIGQKAKLPATPSSPARLLTERP